MCQESILRLCLSSHLDQKIGHLPRDYLTSSVDILYNVDIQIS